MQAPNVLDQILAAKRREIADLKRRVGALRTEAEQSVPTRAFATALRSGKNIALIAEFKRRSPSAGWIRQDGLVTEITKAYSDCGARAISVLTDEKFFGGTLSDLATARAAAHVPILRKDFVLEEVQLFEARAAGADAVLLIARALNDVALQHLLTTARGIGLDVMVETHNEREIERALRAGADVIGVNNRDLSNFQVDLGLTERMVRNLPADVVIVAESGIRNSDDVRALAALGVDAVLVGETLMRASNLCAIVSEFAAQPRHTRAN
jgi:indole-3-glycerol phosphate synthase